MSDENNTIEEVVEREVSTVDDPSAAIPQGEHISWGNDAEPEQESAEPVAEEKQEENDEYTGKDRADLIKMIREAESFNGRQKSEIGDLRKEIEAIRSGMQQQGSTTNDWPDPVEYVVDNATAENLFNAAVDAVEAGQLDVSYLNDVINEAYEVDPRLAMQMSRVVSIRAADLAARQNMQQANAAAQRYDRESYSKNVGVAMDEFAKNPDAPAYEADVVTILTKPANAVEHGIASAYANAKSQASVLDALNDALALARGRNPSKSTTAINDARTNARRNEATLGAYSAGQQQNTGDSILDSFENAIKSNKGGLLSF